MQINNDTITDEQAAALAAALSVTSYADGNDLLQQAAASALLQFNKRVIIAAIAVAQDDTALAPAMDAWNTASVNKLPSPPIKLGGAVTTG